MSVISSLVYCDYEEDKEPFVLTDGDKELKVSKHMLVTTDILGFDINSKKIKSLAIDKLEKTCQNDEILLHELEQANVNLLSKVFCLINELNADFSISNEWNLEKYLKAFDFRVETISIKNCFDKVISYIQIVSELMKDYVVCFVNLKSYFTENQIKEIYKFAIYNNVRLLLIESTLETEKMEYENKLIIDNEFDELILK